MSTRRWRPEQLAVPAGVLLPLSCAPALHALIGERRVQAAGTELHGFLVAVREAALRAREYGPDAAVPGPPAADAGLPVAGGPGSAPFSEAVLNTRQAARRLGVQPRQIRRLIGEGKLAAQEFGSGWLIEPQEIDRYAATRPARRDRKAN